MIEFFKWITTLSSWEAWSLFGLLCIIMSIIPLYPLIKRIIIIKLNNEREEIKDFSWRFSPDKLMTLLDDKGYYIKSGDNNFLLNGSKIILNWNVTGAYRVDIEGLGKWIKGNTANVIVNKENKSFVIIAYTLKGKLTKKINIDPSLIKDLKTFNLSKENHFNQSLFNNKVLGFSKSSYRGKNYSKSGIEKIKIIEKTGIRKNELARHTSPIYQKNNYIQYKFNGSTNNKKLEILKNIEKQKLIFINSFNPENYNNAIFQYTNSINKK